MRLLFVCFMAVFTVFVWGITFVNTKALLTDFSALEIQVLRFAVADLALLVVGRFADPGRMRLTFRDELLCAGMGFFGVAVYQLLENCAIHFTNASNVSILVSTNPMLTALLAWAFGLDRRPGFVFLVGFLVAIAGVAMVSLNGIAEFHFRPAGDLMALAAMASWGGYSILVGRIRREIPQTVVMCRAFHWSLAMMVPFVLFGLTRRRHAGKRHVVARERLHEVPPDGMGKGRAAARRAQRFGIRRRPMRRLVPRQAVGRGQGKQQKRDERRAPEERPRHDPPFPIARIHAENAAFLFRCLPLSF